MEVRQHERKRMNWKGDRIKRNGVCVCARVHKSLKNNTPDSNSMQKQRTLLIAE